MRPNRLDRRARLRCAITCVATLAVAAGLGASAVAAQPSPLSGAWRHGGGEPERTRRLEAIDRATEGMGLLKRGAARGRLRDATEPAARIVIADEGDRVTFAARGRRLTLPTDGTPTRVEGEGGAGMTEVRRRNGDLVVTVRGDKGVRTTVYRVSADGRRLALDVRMTSDDLSEPLRYRATYVRDGD